MAASPIKSPKKARVSSAKPKKVASHPTYAAMTKSAIKNLKEKNGSSKAAILKYILQNYKVGDNIKSIVQINAHLRASLIRGVASGGIKQAKGTGASGSFRLGEKAEKAKKVVAKKPRKSSPKKVATKAKKASPKKAKSPKKVKAPKKAASPKKATKAPKAPKSPKKTVKKSPAKKARKSSPKKKATKA